MTSPGPYANANSAPSEPDPASVFGQPVSPMNRLRDSIAVQPSAGPGVFGAVKTGYRAGKQLAAEQPALAHRAAQVGPVNAPMGYERESTVDAQGPPVDHTANNADAPASQESLDALHSKVDSLQGSVSGMSNSGAAAGSQGGQYRQSGTAKTPYQTPVSALQQQAEKHQQALAGMLASHQNLAQSRARHGGPLCPATAGRAGCPGRACGQRYRDVRRLRPAQLLWPAGVRKRHIGEHVGVIPLVPVAPQSSLLPVFSPAGRAPEAVASHRDERQMSTPVIVNIDGSSTAAENPGAWSSVQGSAAQYPGPAAKVGSPTNVWAWSVQTVNSGQSS